MKTVFMTVNKTINRKELNTFTRLFTGMELVFIEAGMSAILIVPKILKKRWNALNKDLKHYDH